MFWTLDFDDFGNNLCNQGSYPLIAQMGTALQAANPPSASSTGESVDCSVSLFSNMQ